MPFLKNVLRDLVDKNLWPIAVGLVVLLAAVPIVLGRGTEAPAARPATAAVASAGATDGVVTVAATAPAQRSRAGRLRDPFVQPKVKAPDATTSSAAPSTATSAGATASTGSTSSAGESPSVTSTATTSHATVTTGTSTGPSTGTATGVGTDPTKAAPSTAPKQDVTRVTLRFGQPGSLKVLGDIPRLGPLPSALNPSLVFLGVLKDRRTAVFLVSSDVQETLGDGVCRPRADRCETIELREGDTEFFDLVTRGGKSVQYQIDVKDVHVGKVDRAQALAAYARRSTAGQELVRTAAVSEGVDALRAYHYKPAEGVLVRAKVRGGARTASGSPRYVFRHGEVPVFRALRPAAR